MLIETNGPFERRHETLQDEIRFAAHLTSAQTEVLANHAFAANSLDPDGPLAVRAVCLFVYALQKFGLVTRPENASFVAWLAHVARRTVREMPEVMAARWILGRVRLAEAAGQDLPLSVQRDLIERALKCFCYIREVETDHPILLPGILVEYPEKLFLGRHPLDIDPPVRKIYPPYRYRMATAAALIRLDPERACQYGGDVHDAASALLQAHPEAELAHVNGELSIAAAIALAPGQPLTAHDREIGYRLAGRIHSLIRANNLPDRKKHEWLAASHAVNAILADTEREAVDETIRMANQLETLFAKSFRSRLPDFTRVDAVYRGAFSRVCGGEQSLDYGEFIRRLMPGV